ncbi:Ribonuclease [Trichinella spiralis]|uniref:Ribonuclease n=1 Tax=Trichinella spiralis TaxID=6334 RepID=A0ABR3KCV9_TRISP
MIVCYSRQPFSLLLHIVEEANDRCVCTERVVSEASQRQNFHATCPPICSWNQVLPWTVNGFCPTMEFDHNFCIAFFKIRDIQ